jgi:hypothetical protein
MLLSGGLRVDEEAGHEGVTGLKRCPELRALTRVSAISEGAVRGRLHMFAFDRRVGEESDQLAERARTITNDLCGVPSHGALVLMMRMEERSGGKFRSLTCSMPAHAANWPFSSSAGAPRRAFRGERVGGIDMASMALALVTHDDARLAFRAVHLSVAEHAPAMLGSWPARCASCSADQR